MAFHIYCLDDPAKPGLRKQMRPTHLEYMIAHKDRILFGGPIKSVDGTVSIGSAFSLDYRTRREVDSFLADEPYSKAGLFETVMVREMSVMVPERHEGFLESELQRELGSTNRVAEIGR
jgi:uncharacterized protein